MNNESQSNNYIQQSGNVPSLTENSSKYIDIIWKFYNQYDYNKYTNNKFKGIITHAAVARNPLNRFDWHPETFDNIGFMYPRQDRKL